MIVQENGNFHNQVQASIAIGLGMLDVILALNQRDIILAEKAIGQHINIAGEGADYADARDIADVLFNAVNGQRQPLARYLIHNALGRF